MSVQEEREGKKEEAPFAATNSVNYGAHAVEGDPVQSATQRRWSGPKPKYRHLLQDREMRRWYDNVCRGSRITADVYLRRLGFLCNAKGIADPNELVHRARTSGERWAYSFLMDIVTEMEADGKAGSYTESTLKAVKSWLAHNAVEVKGRIKIKGARDTPTLRDKRALSGPELALFFSNAPPQTRCAAVIIAEAGLRIESVGNYDGSDGLRIGDLPEMEVANDDSSGSEPRISFSRLPTMVVVRPELSKAGHQYLTFLTAEGCRYLAEYLMKRMRSGERMDGSSPLITPGNIKQRKNLFVRSMLVSDLIRKRLKGCGINSRPYDLRTTFATQMMLAESKGQIIRDYRVFFMGHKGDIEHTYTTNRHLLPSKVIEDMRSSFARAQRFLQSEGVVSEEHDLMREMRTQLLLAAGFTDEEVSEMDVPSMGSEQLHAAIKRKLLGVMANNGSKQKVVALGEIEQYISNGWEFVAALSNEKAILKLPF